MEHYHKLSKKNENVKMITLDGLNHDSYIKDENYGSVVIKFYESIL